MKNVFLVLFLLLAQVSHASSFSAGGTLTVTFPDGTVGAPGQSFTSDLDNGWWRIGADNWAGAAGGIKVIEFATTSVTVPVTLYVSNTTQSTSVSTGAMNTAGGLGVTKDAFIGGLLDVAGVTRHAAGTVTAPGIAWTADVDGTGTGLYRSAADATSFAANGVSVGTISATGAWTIGAAAGTATHLVKGQMWRLDYPTANSTASMQVRHSDGTNGNSHAILYLETGGASGGDPKVQFFVTGGQDWATGIDNSASDAYVISNSGNLGTNNAMSCSTALTCTFGGVVSAATGGIVTKHSDADVSNPPTNAEIVAIFGTAATTGQGFIATIDDNNAHTNVYEIISDGTKYWTNSPTAAP